jgi:hypothetical protein
MSRTTNPRIRQVWQTRIVDRPNSGLSIARFCDQQGCSEASFYHWKRRLAQAPQGDQQSDHELPANLNSFYQLTSSSCAPVDQIVELNLPGGVIARIPLDPMSAMEFILRYSAPFAKE